MEGIHAGAHREIFRVPGLIPMLGQLSPLVILEHSRYADLLSLIAPLRKVPVPWYRRKVPPRWQLGF